MKNSVSPIEKPTIIVTSLGRTGTKFFSVLLGELLQSVTSLHEPDVVNLENDRGFLSLIPQIRESGISNLIIRKTLGKWSLIELSDARARGQLSYDEAVREAILQRREFVRRQAGNVYVESNVGYYGIIDILNAVFAHHRLAYIVRDGRSWVQSHMNWGQMYGKSLIRRQVAHTWPSASQFKDDPYSPKWDTWTRFEKLCWSWAKLNEYALATVRTNRNAKVFYFEDIFESQDRYHHLEELICFVTALPYCEPPNVSSLDGWLDRRIHQSHRRFRGWDEWSPSQKRRFEATCGSLMEKLGYELD